MSDERKIISRETYVTNRFSYVTNRFSYVTLKAAKTAVEELIAEFGEDARLVIGLQYNHYAPEPNAAVVVSYQTPETDEEINTRIRRVKQAEQERRMQYERLKKEFGEG